MEDNVCTDNDLQPSCPPWAVAKTTREGKQRKLNFRAEELLQKGHRPTEQGWGMAMTEK